MWARACVFWAVTVAVPLVVWRGLHVMGWPLECLIPDVWWAWWVEGLSGLMWLATLLMAIFTSAAAVATSLEERRRKKTVSQKEAENDG